jgi:hypothetical protein
MNAINDNDLHAMVRRACDEALEYVNAPHYERDSRRIKASMDRIEAEIRLREYDAFQREHPPWTPPRINPWGC